MRGRAAVLGACLFSAACGMGLEGRLGPWPALALALSLAAVAAALAVAASVRPAGLAAPVLARQAMVRPEAPPAPAPSRPAEFRAPPGAMFLTPADFKAFRVRVEADQERMKRLHVLALDLEGNLGALASCVAGAADRNAELLESAERDGAQVGTEIQALAGVRDALRQGTEVIDELARSSREVGSVVESIFVVARKTNMVALNAAIEAARAGEQGRGFAVVAEEVRRLAEVATASTQKVEGFVENLAERTASTVQVLRGAARIEDTLQVVYRVSDAFASLVPAVEAANASLGELSSLVEENRKEMALLRDAAEAGMAAAGESLARLDAMAKGGPKGEGTQPERGRF